MSQGLRELQPYDLSAELERAILPVLVDQLKARGAGHCMRLSDLDAELMVRLCGRLRAEVPSATVVVLTNGVQGSVPEGLAVTSTKLVELRNPLSDGTLRPPLLVFVPNNVRAAAEDSFGVATFEELDVGDVYEQLRERIVADAPASLRGSLVECLRRLTDSGEPWPFADAVAVTRFLLTAKVNGADSESYGGALYELGLVPDFELFSDPARAPARIVRNRECVGKITWSSRSERGRVLQLGLSERAFRNQLGNFLAEAGVEDPRTWTRRIVLDRNLWPLAFNRWEFEDGGEEPDAVFIGDVTTDLSNVEEDAEDEKLSQLIGQQILPLGGAGLKKFSVRFRVDPHPAKVQGLAKFVIQVVSKEQGPVGLARSKALWKSTTQNATVSFSKLNKVEWDEGWHFVRVLAQTEDGDLIPLVDESGALLPWAPDDSAPGVARPNESDLFYVLPDGEVDVESPQRAVQRESSLSHAQLRLQFTALLDDRDPGSIRPTSVQWAERKPRGRTVGAEMIEAKFGREGALHIPVSRTLKVTEQRILAAPDGPLSWRVSIKLGVAGSSTGEQAQWPEGPVARAFLEARARYFEAVRSGSSELVTQAADLQSLRDLVSSYASSYLALVEHLSRRTETSEPIEAQRALSDLRRVLAVDSVFLSISDHRDRRREATLVSPTHPLRALWLTTWAELGATWLEAAKAAPKEFAVATRDALLRHLAPTSYPPVLPHRVRIRPDRRRQPEPVLDPLLALARGRPARPGRRRLCRLRPAGARDQRCPHRRSLLGITSQEVRAAAPIRSHARHQRIQRRTRSCPRRHAVGAAEGASVWRPSIQRPALRARSRGSGRGRSPGRSPLTHGLGSSARGRCLLHANRESPAAQAAACDSTDDRVPGLAGHALGTPVSPVRRVPGRGCRSHAGDVTRSVLPSSWAHPGFPHRVP